MGDNHEHYTTVLNQRSVDAGSGKIGTCPRCNASIIRHENQDHCIVCASPIQWGQEQGLEYEGDIES